jgi:glycosyltransferase involved in cell wall biosynthesis
MEHSQDRLLNWLSTIIARVANRRRALQKAADWVATDPAGGVGGAELLSISPTIVHTFPGPVFPLGAASVLGPRLRRAPVHFLLAASWTLELEGQSERLANIAKSYTQEHSRHHLTFVSNTERETELMRAQGCTAVTINHNCLSDEETFKPIPQIEPVFDAVYNARFAPWKRHELAQDIKKLVLIYFRHNGEESVEHFHARHAHLSAMMPNACFMNELTPDGCQWMSSKQVNRVLAQSKVGLCLSEIEGAMRASIEYLFAGLSVVSTPSLGGRDFYFDDEYCIICESDPRRVREAVEALVARNVPRDYVRARTLSKINLQRKRYIDLVQGLIDRAGGKMHFEDHFWKLTRGESIIRWGSMEEFSKVVCRLVREQPKQFSSAWDRRYAASPWLSRRRFRRLFLRSLLLDER